MGPQKISDIYDIVWCDSIQNYLIYSRTSMLHDSEDRYFQNLGYVARLMNHAHVNSYGLSREASDKIRDIIKESVININKSQEDYIEKATGKRPDYSEFNII